MRWETYSFEGIVACVLHVCCARIVDLDLLALLGGHRDEKRVDARPVWCTLLILGRWRGWRISVGCWGCGRGRGTAFTRSRSHSGRVKMWFWFKTGVGVVRG